MHAQAEESGSPFEQADEELKYWSAWARSGRFGQRKSLELRLVEEGGMLISGQGQRVMPFDGRAERTEQLVCEMPPIMREAVKQKYLFGGSNGRRARACGCSVAEFKARVRIGLAWLSAKLSR